MQWKSASKLHYIFLSLSIWVVACRGEWDEADKLYSELRCGLSPSEVGELAARHGAEDIGCPAPEEYHSDECFVSHGLTFFSFRFDSNQRLVAVTRGRFYGLTGLRLAEEVSLCSESEPQ